MKDSIVSVITAWDNPQQTIIRVTFDGQWEVGDMFRIINEVTLMIRSVNHNVDSIFDFTLSSISPPKLLSTLERMEETHNENERLLIVVKPNAYIRALAKVAKLLAPKTFQNMHFVDCLDKAYAIIQQHEEFSLA